MKCSPRKQRIKIMRLLWLQTLARKRQLCGMGHTVLILYSAKSFQCEMQDDTSGIYVDHQNGDSDTEWLLLCTAGQAGCLPWLAVVCMYHRRRSCRIAYGRHHVIVCVQSCVCSEGEHTLHISCCFGGRRQISLRLLYLSLAS